jgi:hypothetical protein
MKALYRGIGRRVFASVPDGDGRDVIHWPEEIAEGA